jgi:hypothetical protein
LESEVNIPGALPTENGSELPISGADTRIAEVLAVDRVGDLWDM